MDMEQWELKAHGASRRRQRMRDMGDGRSYATRWIDPATIYSRGMKHRPRAAEDWEEVDL